MAEDIREVARFAGWDIEIPEQAALLERMGVVLAALIGQLQEVRRLDLGDWAPSGLGEVRSNAPRF